MPGGVAVKSLTGRSTANGMRTLRTSRRRTLAAARIVLVAALVALTLAPTGSQAAPAHRAPERQFLQLMNASRRAHGHRALVASPAVAAVARAWSRRMAARGDLRHNPDVGGQLPVDWRRWGENVGWASNGSGRSVRAVTRRLHRSFMESDGHRANILGDFNQVGVGVALDDEGTMWATMVFVDAPLGDRPDGRRSGRGHRPYAFVAAQHHRSLR